MSTSLEIVPVQSPIEASIRPPGSKSLTNRAMLCAALARGRSTLHGALDSEDTRTMAEALEALGIALTADWDRGQIELEGCDGVLPANEATLHLRGSGTSFRFLTALVATGQGTFTLDGNSRMRERPIAPLTEALQTCGIAVDSQQGFPPVVVRASGLAGGRIALRGDLSSQYLSGLLMAAPAAMSPLKLSVEGPLVSAPYIEMTLSVMDAFGVKVTRSEAMTFDIAPQPYLARNYPIEPDASAASYFWAAAAITGGRVRVEGLTSDSLQGDVAFCDCLRQMGCSLEQDEGGTTVVGGPLEGITVDMRDFSDTVQTLAAVALFAKGTTTIEGVEHIRHKESDRIGDLARELRKLGADVKEMPGGMRITPTALGSATIETYDDHRMAMSLGLIGLRVPGIRILDPGCTAKTYPGFFDDLQAITASAQ